MGLIGLSITNEMIVELIGAFASILAAVFSTIAIILTNRNKTALERLKNSGNVKSDLASKRYAVYQEIIGFINSWHDIKFEYNNSWIDCTTRILLEHGVFTHKFKSITDVQNELDKIHEIKKNYYYLDKQSLFYLVCIEKHLKDVVEFYYALREGEIKEDLYLYVAYCDVFKFVDKLAKCVNKYIKSVDSLKFKFATGVNHYKVIKLLESTDFTNIYVNYMGHKAMEDMSKKSIDLLTSDYKHEIKEIEAQIQVEEDKRIKKLLYKKINVIQKGITKLEKLSVEKNNVRFNNVFKAWQLCSKCKNPNCCFNKKETKN